MGLQMNIVRKIKFGPLLLDALEHASGQGCKVAVSLEGFHAFMDHVSYRHVADISILTLGGQIKKLLASECDVVTLELPYETAIGRTASDDGPETNTRTGPDRLPGLSVTLKRADSDFFSVHLVVRSGPETALLCWSESVVSRDALEKTSIQGWTTK